MLSRNQVFSRSVKPDVKHQPSFSSPQCSFCMLTAFPLSSSVQLRTAISFDGVKKSVGDVHNDLELPGMDFLCVHFTYCAPML